MRTRRLIATALVLAALAVAPAAYAAVDAFIWFDQVKGESKDPQHQNWIEVESFQLQEVNRQAVGAERDLAKIHFSDITVKRIADKASPALFKAYSEGKRYPNAIVEMRKAGGGPQEYLKITLQDVFFSSYQVSGGGAGATETIKLKFARMKMEYTGQTKPTTTAHTAVVASGVSKVGPTATPTPAPRSGVVAPPVVR